ncbi:hypothetical protein SK069_17650 [Patulibacter brassicae]|jgi:hypothetical protein|uniref:Uncharacterized protein n=1 Tax=Patulibacter brassicae TaxID=1705717 RepID=A0ABU4VNJ6_9ACTN|nr:hypothetical protein [Patulibacter brassicae]MDX8153427.1 hypothetical protein [Patulibacter brassicae]
MRLRRLTLLVSTLVATLTVSVGTAMAGIDSGQGTIGENNDLQVTLFGFAVIVGIPAFALVMSLLQWRLDKRKYAKLAAKKARQSTRDERLGW